jgi:hypothetical protein
MLIFEMLLALRWNTCIRNPCQGDVATACGSSHHRLRTVEPRSDSSLAVPDSQALRKSRGFFVRPRESLLRAMQLRRLNARLSVSSGCKNSVRKVLCFSLWRDWVRLAE